MKFSKITLIAAIASVSTLTATAQGIPAGVNRADMDLTVSPGEDFFQYAGGGWMKANPLKPEYASYGIFNDLAEKNREQLKELFDNLANEKHARGTVGQKVTDLFNLAMDSVRLNREGATPLMQDLANVQAFKKANLTPFIADQHLHLANPFFGIAVEADLMNSDMNVLYMEAGTSGLPDRDYYLNTDADSKKIQQAYIDYLVKMYMLAGYKKGDAKKAAKTVYDIEYQFAQAEMSKAEARDYTKQYNIFTLEQLQERYP
ncbi:MAG: M13 family peptidase, partial [Muribaculaceae bacterium]|nr:M13 family peptidase [Muribaculaceae bacterium]